MIRKLLARLVRRAGEPEEINGHGRCPTYLYRWELASITLLGRTTKIYLHKFVGDDWALDLHDHPKRFVSIGLAGKYTEISAIDVNGNKGVQLRDYSAPWIRTFPAEHRHRLIGPTPIAPCWTLVIVGPAAREWGFWHRGEFVHWRSYVSAGSTKATVGCR